MMVLEGKVWPFEDWEVLECLHLLSQDELEYNYFSVQDVVL